MKALALSFFLLVSFTLFSQHYKKENNKFILTIEGASHLASLPLKCIQQEYPYKTGIVFTDSSYIKKPSKYHPAFYGCFDWHSSVHGHWMLVKLLKTFPTMPQADNIRNILRHQLTYQNIQTELNIFKNKDNKSFERTYGWAWILQLQKELLGWKDTLGVQLSGNLQPLADHFSMAYRDYLGKLVYPLRAGDHPNLAFGLRLAWDYASVKKDDSLLKHIRKTSVRFYGNDINCPVTWEPGGTDF